MFVACSIYKVRIPLNDEVRSGCPKLGHTVLFCGFFFSGNILVIRFESGQNRVGRYLNKILIMDFIHGFKMYIWETNVFYFSSMQIILTLLGFLKP